jgi:hypothetical protein
LAISNYDSSATILAQELPILIVQRQLLNQLHTKTDSPVTAQLQPLFVLVPHGDANDSTRPPAFYDETYAFSVSCGIPELK